MAVWNSTGGQSGHPLPGHGMLPLVARGTPTSKVLLAWTLLSQLTDSLLRSRRGASVFFIPAGNRERFADICEPNSALTVQRQRKRPGGAVGSRPARKRSRLLPSSAGGTSQTEPRDLEESGAPAFEPEVIDLTGDDIRDLPGESSEAEVITISDNESPVEREQSQQQPHLCRASENSVEPLARNDEEEPIEDDGPGSRTSSTHSCPEQQRIQLVQWQLVTKRNQEIMMVLLTLMNGQTVLRVLRHGRMTLQMTGKGASSTHFIRRQQRIRSN
ncbi:uncharacterized protein VK521_003398 [Ammospiza maritima maritima]